MSAPRLAYDDASTPAEMGADCLAVQAALARTAPVTRPLTDRARDLSVEHPKRGEIEISAAAARLAAALSLQLDGD